MSRARTRGMSRAHTLEDRYRRLLALYPAEHRAVHGEEMLGILMMAADPGQRRPGRAESAALVWGAVRIWLRPGRGAAHQHWQDGLAAVSVLLPLLVSAYWVLGQAPALISRAHDGPIFTAMAYSAAQTTGPWLIVAVAALLGRRRIAAVIAAGMLIFSALTTATAPNFGYIAPPSMMYAVAAGLEVVALLTSPGPRRGRQILTWKHYVLAGVVAATAASAGNWLWLPHPVLADAVIIGVIGAGLAMLGASSPAGRRSMVLLLIPAYYLVLGFVLPPSMISLGADSYQSGWEGLPRITLTCAPLAVIAVAAVLSAVRYARRPQPAAPGSPPPPPAG